MTELVECGYVECDVKFDPTRDRHGRRSPKPRRFCCRKHKEAQGRLIRPTRPELRSEPNREEVDKPCAWEECGQTFRSLKYLHRRYCSPECRYRAKKHREAKRAGRHSGGGRCSDGLYTEPPRQIPAPLRPLADLIRQRPGASPRFYAGQLGWPATVVRAGIVMLAHYQLSQQVVPGCVSSLHPDRSHVSGSSA